MKKTIAYIHGLNSSHRSFSFIVDQLPDHNVVNINYDSHQSLNDSLIQVVGQLPSSGTYSLVGHSLGGLIATLLADCLDSIEKIVTISSPLGGSKAANIVRWIPGHPAIIEDIVPNSPYISQIAKSKINIPTLNIISTGGHLYTSLEPNDSVVTVSSQLALPIGQKVEVKANHFEVLLHEKTVEHIQNHIFKDSQ